MKRLINSSKYVGASVSIGDVEPGMKVKTMQGDVVYITKILNDDWVWYTENPVDRDNPNALGYALPIHQIVKVFRR